MSSRMTTRWILLATVSAGLLLITIDNSVLYTALPTLTRELGANATEGLWIINAYPLVMAGLLLGAGTLGDRIGHKRMFVIGLVVFGAASVLAAFSPTPEVLIGARGLLAVGAAAMMPATLALIRVSFDDQRERNIAISVWGSVAVVGAALGPIVGGALLEVFWWGSVFLVNVPVVLVALIATAIVAPGGDRDRSRPWDLLSSVQAMLGLGGLVVALKEATKADPAWPVLGVAAVVGAVAFTLFLRRQIRLPYPLLDLRLFRIPALTAGVVAAGLSLFAVAGVELATSQYFQLVEGFTPLQAGLVVVSFAVGSLPSSLLGGAVLHRVGPRMLIAGGLGIAAVGVVLAIALLPAGWGGPVAGLVVAGLGLGFVMASASSAIVGSAPRHRAGMAASVEEVSYEFGGLVAVAVLGSLIFSIETGYPVVMVIVAAVLVGGAGLSWFLLRRTDATALTGH
ncbi:MFS transporter [Herbiconiux sp. YIM B11900]|uniref:MFS transporter n=1 Tax=Herbiconiux sp. YIM B11900 TaxID=3404131 RepID=UPI003F8636E8